MNTIHQFYGVPQILVSNRDKVFTSPFWRELTKVVGTILHLSSIYHPQTESQTERLNRCLEMYLRYMVHQQPKKWTKWLVAIGW